MKRYLTAALLLILLATGLALKTICLQYDPVAGACAKFAITGLFGKEVKGTIGGLRSHIHFDPAHPEEAVISASVMVATVNTGNKKRDRHLRTEDFFYE